MAVDVAPARPRARRTRRAPRPTPATRDLTAFETKPPPAAVRRRTSSTPDRGAGFIGYGGPRVAGGTAVRTNTRWSASQGRPDHRLDPAGPLTAGPAALTRPRICRDLAGHLRTRSSKTSNRAPKSSSSGRSTSAKERRVTGRAGSHPIPRGTRVVADPKGQPASCVGKAGGAASRKRSVRGAERPEAERAGPSQPRFVCRISGASRAFVQARADDARGCSLEVRPGLDGRQVWPRPVTGEARILASGCRIGVRVTTASCASRDRRRVQSRNLAPPFTVIGAGSRQTAPPRPLLEPSVGSRTAADISALHLDRWSGGSRPAGGSELVGEPIRA